MSAEKPDLKIIEHPDIDKQWNVQIIDFGWAKVKIETDEHDLTLANAVYILELAKLELMSGK